MFFVLLAFVATQPGLLIFWLNRFRTDLLSWSAAPGVPWSWVVSLRARLVPPSARLLALGVLGLVSGLGPFRAPGPWSLGRGSLVVGFLGAATTGAGVVAPNRICQ